MICVLFADIKPPIKAEDVKSEVKTEAETPVGQIGPITVGQPPKKEEEYDSSATVSTQFPQYCGIKA